MEKQVVLAEGKKKQINRKAVLVHTLSFFIPCILFATVWLFEGIGIGTTYSPLTYDLRAQYFAFFAYLKHIIAGEASSFYSFSIGMGDSVLPIVAYYLASPLNVIFAFFDMDHLVDAVYWLSIIKVGLCGLTFSIYLRYGLNRAKASYIQVVFSCCYALMSYIVMFIMCLMWIDGVILLPLILTGIEQILDEKKGYLYFASITTLFISNYYISYMVGLFAATYILCGVFVKYEKGTFKRYFFALVRFALHTINGLLISALLLVPALLSYYYSINPEIAGESAYDNMYQFSFLDVLKKLLPQQYDSIEYEGLPYIYCGTIVVVLAVLYFAQRHAWKEKIRAAVLLFVTGIGFFVPFIDRVWHAFRVPHCYMFRYSFLFSTVLIMLAYNAYISMNSNKVEHKNAVILLLSFYTLIELVMNGTVVTAGLSEETDYYVNSQYDKTYEIYSKLIAEINKDSNPIDFYRVGKGGAEITKNDSMMFDVNGIDSFTSTYNYQLEAFLNLLGIDDLGTCVITSRTATPFLDAVFGIKYRIELMRSFYPYELIREEWIEPYAAQLYKNEHYLSPGIVVPEQYRNGFIFTQDFLENQNTFATNLLGKNVELYEKLTYTTVGETSANAAQLQVEQLKDGEMFLVIDATFDLDKMAVYDGTEDESKDNTVIMVDGKIATVYTNYRAHTERIDRHLYYLGEISVGKHTVDVSLPEYCSVTLCKAYRYDESAFSDLYTELSEKQMQIIASGDDFIEGVVSIHSGEMLLTTVPYINGICVDVDGTSFEDYGRMGAFTAIYLPEGEHQVRIYFKQPGMNVGIMAFAIGIVLSIICCIFLMRNKAKLS